MRKAFFLLVISFVIATIAVFIYLDISNITEFPPLAGKILWHGNTSLPEVALTFDDGPNSKATPRILEILNKYDVKATFFVLGKYIAKNSDILRRAAEDGHVIGNHTQSHLKGPVSEAETIKLEVDEADKLIGKYSGKKAKYFRPPFGYENWRFLNEAEKLDNKVILWTLDVGDWNDNKTVKDITSKILSKTRNGTIILLHDGGTSREAVIKALPIVIKGLRKKGFKFVTIDEMVSHL